MSCAVGYLGMIFEVLTEEKGRTDDEVERKTISENPGC